MTCIAVSSNWPIGAMQYWAPIGPSNARDLMRNNFFPILCGMHLEGEMAKNGEFWSGLVHFRHFLPLPPPGAPYLDLSWAIFQDIGGCGGTCFSLCIRRVAGLLNPADSKQLQENKNDYGSTKQEERPVEASEIDRSSNLGEGSQEEWVILTSPFTLNYF